MRWDEFWGKEAAVSEMGWVDKERNRLFLKIIMNSACVHWDFIWKIWYYIFTVKDEAVKEKWEEKEESFPSAFK